MSTDISAVQETLDEIQRSHILRVLQKTGWRFSGENGAAQILGINPPKGKEKNWIPTVPERGWFAYFRLYAPTEPYFDRTWQLPDIEKTN